MIQKDLLTKHLTNWKWIREKEQEIAERKGTNNCLNANQSKSIELWIVKSNYPDETVLMHGTDKETQENTDQVVINILHIKNINRSHSLGNKIFEMIFKNRRKSKGKPISLTKTQIKARMEQLQKDREENIFWRT